MNNIKIYLLRKIREPSTWAGLSVLGALVGVSPEAMGMVQQVFVGAAGLLLIATKEGA